MIFLIACGLMALVIVFAAGIVEAWARHRHWIGYDDRPVRFQDRRGRR